MTLTTAEVGSRRLYSSLHFQVFAGILFGIALGLASPSTGAMMKPLGDAFISLIRMMIVPVIFFTVVVGIASVGDLQKVGRVGLKTIAYFEVVTTVSLLLGFAVVTLMRPGAGINATPDTLDINSVKQYINSPRALHFVDFLLNIIPDTAVDAFARGEILQVLLLAILVGVALAGFKDNRSSIETCERICRILFRVIEIIMKLAPIGAFGAMAFTVGRFGLGALLPLGKLVFCAYFGAALFIGLILGLISYLNGVNLWHLLRYIKEELLIVLGTASSESVLAPLIQKLERLGCSKSVVGLVVPSGYSFNLDGTALYLSVAALFVAQATNTHLSSGQIATLFVVLMLTSKGAAAVTGGGFITLAATLSTIRTVPVDGISLLLGVDRFMSQMRAVTNLIGNAVAAVVIARWENEFNAERARAILSGELARDDGAAVNEAAAEPAFK